MTYHDATDIRIEQPQHAFDDRRGVEDQRDDVERRFAGAGLQNERNHQAVTSMRGWQFDMTRADSYAGYFATPK